jgi:hypothetical protein
MGEDRALNPAAVDALEELDYPLVRGVALVEGRLSLNFLKALDYYTGTPGTFSTIDVALFYYSGRRFKVWDEQFFETIYVIPRVRDLGSIQSDTSFEVQVWAANEYPHLCTGYVITGPAGLSLSGGFALPHWWAPFGSAFYTVDVSILGDPNIDNLITWVFPGFGGTDCHVLGLRVVLFAQSPTWQDGISEVFGYLTEVMQAWDGSEQRVALKEVPDRTLTFQVVTMSEEESSVLGTRLWMVGQNLWAVPRWMDAAPLNVAVAPGDAVVMVTTAGQGFESGGMAAVWRSATVWEAFRVDTVLSDRLVLNSPARSAWPVAGTTVVPVVSARLLKAAELAHLRPGLLEANVEFSVESA